MEVYSFLKQKRYSIRAILIILLVSFAITATNYYTIKILSSIRGYVNGESQYSRAQKNATAHLIDYIYTRNELSYKLFKKELSVPIADSLARIGMQESKPYERIKKALVLARNHSDDVPNMIWLFVTFQNFPYFKEAIYEWKRADVFVGELDRIAYKIKHGQVEIQDTTELLARINAINKSLTYHQQGFSSILGEASRVITQALYYVNFFFVILIVAIGGSFCYELINKLQSTKEELARQNYVKEEFMSIAAHELKTPLTSMKAGLQVLDKFTRSNPQAHKVQPFVFNSNKQVNRLINLVNELLDVTRIEQGKLTISKKKTNLAELINEAVAEASSLFNHDIIYTKPLEETAVMADPQRMLQVLINLLSNAAKYSPKATEVHLWMEVENQEVRVFIRDFGVGIPKEKIPILFQKFYRVYENETVIQGLGLGLFICKQIVNGHDGDLGVTSYVGEGSTFWICLPLADYQAS
ncbi:sensor histidine kinase [Desertivirga brevis]|uniref:sensor histidine kinase n=1 Tax=Desertivirga brevis TaxID=2810310 RepID=UPI001A95BF2C|nr:HAMP domain-containing sensor histidine kinase [Pedobacter sp. SYSU D00873]